MIFTQIQQCSDTESTWGIKVENNVSQSYTNLEVVAAKVEREVSKATRNRALIHIIYLRDSTMVLDLFASKWQPWEFIC